jgi:hypothetical protein
MADHPSPLSPASAPASSSGPQRARPPTSITAAVAAAELAALEKMIEPITPAEREAYIKRVQATRIAAIAEMEREIERNFQTNIRHLDAWGSELFRKKEAIEREKNEKLQSIKDEFEGKTGPIESEWHEKYTAIYRDLQREKNDKLQPFLDEFKAKKLPIEKEFLDKNAALQEEKESMIRDLSPKKEAKKREKMAELDAKFDKMAAAGPPRRAGVRNYPSIIHGGGRYKQTRRRKNNRNRSRRQ